MIKLDSTQFSTVVSCTDCSWWHALTNTKGEGWASGARHEARVHPERDQARDASRKHDARN